MLVLQVYNIEFRMKEAIIYKHLIGESTPEEETELQDWLETSDENRQLFFDIKVIWENRHLYADKTNPLDAYESLATMNKKLDQINTSTSKKISPKESITVSCKIKNTGKIKGEEVVQLYLHDIVSDVALPVNELKGFQRISLEPNEEKVVNFTLSPESLSHLNLNMKQVVEPGDYRVMIGSSSKDIKLKDTFNVHK